MLTRLVLISVLLALVPQDSALSRSGVSDRDLQKLAKDVNGFFEALDQDERGDQLEYLEKLEKALTKSAKKAKVDGSMLQHLGDWDVILESAKEAPRAVTSAYGKGFFRHVFADPWDVSERRVVSLVSVPATAKASELLPVIVALKHDLGESGKTLDSSVTELATAMYGPLLETHIVLIPMGLEEGTGRKAETVEVDGSWLSDSGLYVFFTSYRILLEQLGFDRGRVVLDGWLGASGLDALRLGSTTAFFAGLVLRSADVDAPELALENLAGVPVLYVKGSDDGGPGELGALTDLDVPGFECVVVEEGASALAPSAETLGAMGDWLAERRRDLAPSSFAFKPGDVRFGSINWCTATNINRRASAMPGDPDFPSLKVEVDRETNTINIDTVNVLELYVYLSDEVVDMDKTVEIRINDEQRVKKRFNRSLRFLLKTRFYNDSGDYGLYTARELIEDIDANVPEG